MGLHSVLVVILIVQGYAHDAGQFDQDHRMQVLQVDTTADASSPSSACGKQLAAYSSTCTIAADDPSCNGATSCRPKKDRLFLAVASACTAAEDADALRQTADDHGAGSGRCLRQNNMYCYTNGQKMLADAVANSTSDSDFESRIGRICSSPASCAGRALALSTDPTERYACKASSGGGSKWCAKELQDLKAALNGKDGALASVAPLCSSCSRRYGYLPRDKIDTFCQMSRGEYCGDKLVRSFNMTGTLQGTSPCRNMDTSRPGSCTDECRDFLTGVVADAGCCLGTAFQNSMAASSGTTAAAALASQLQYYKDDCGVAIPDACESGQTATTVTFVLMITNLANARAHVSTLCSAIQMEVSDWFQVAPSDVGCLLLQNTFGSFQINFATSKGDVKGDQQYLQQRSTDGLLSVPLITSNLWADSTTDPTVTVAGLSVDDAHTAPKSAAANQSGDMFILLAMIAINYLL